MFCQVGSASIGLRLNSLYRTLAETNENVIRELILQRLAFSVWQAHPRATGVRAVCGLVLVPSLADAAVGKSDSYKALYAYDFEFRRERQ